MSHFFDVELASPEQRRRLRERARQRHWGLALLLIGWLHLLAFSFCYYLTIGLDYHGTPGYLAVWIGELLGMWVIFRLCASGTLAPQPRPRLRPQPLEQFIRRVWISYFILAFNLGSLNTLRGHEMFEFFPAMASLASFAFFMMTIIIDWRFFGAVVVLFVSGLLMAAHLLHAFLIFAVAWWLVLNGIGLTLWRGSGCKSAPDDEESETGAKPQAALASTSK